MIKFLLLLLFSFSALAYVPTVESLFRHGSNPEVISNGLSITLAVRKQVGDGKSAAQDVALVKEGRTEDFYKIFFTKAEGDHLKVAQTRYSNSSFSESSLEHKVYYSNFNPLTIKPEIESLERGLFFSLLHSIALNNGSHLVSFLKAAGVPVKLNNEIINREKVEYLASYKHYLATINKDRNARKTLENPLRPEDAGAREKVDRVMNEPMYVDTQQVKLGRDEGEVAWLVSAGAFEAVVSYQDRQIQKLKIKSQAGELEMVCKNYWMANGSHNMPRYIMIKDFKGENYQIEITNLRHYLEKDEDINRRLKKWDGLLKGKNSIEARPAFLL